MAVLRQKVGSFFTSNLSLIRAWSNKSHYVSIPITRTLNFRCIKICCPDLTRIVLKFLLTIPKIFKKWDYNSEFLQRCPFYHFTLYLNSPLPIIFTRPFWLNIRKTSTFLRHQVYLATNLLTIFQYQSTKTMLIVYFTSNNLFRLPISLIIRQNQL